LVIGAFVDRKRLASERGFDRAELSRAEQASIGGHGIPRVQLHHIAGDECPRIDLEYTSSSDHCRALYLECAEGFDSAPRAKLSRKTEYDIEGEDRNYRQCVARIADEQTECRSDDQQKSEYALELIGEDYPPCDWGCDCEHVRAVAGKACLRLRFGNPVRCALSASQALLNGERVPGNLKVRHSRLYIRTVSSRP